MDKGLSCTGQYLGHCTMRNSGRINITSLLHPPLHGCALVNNGGPVTGSVGVCIAPKLRAMPRSLVAFICLPPVTAGS